MKKSEIMAASTENLLVELIRMVTSRKILKCYQKTAIWICQELESRNVIDNAESFYERWDSFYIW